MTMRRCGSPHGRMRNWAGAIVTGVGLLGLIASPAQADKYWIGSTDPNNPGDFNADANWSSTSDGLGTPTTAPSAETAFFNALSGTGASFFNTGNVSLTNLVIGRASGHTGILSLEGGSLTTAAFTFGNTGNGVGVFNLEGGHFTATGSSSIGNAAGSGTMNISGGTFTVTAGNLRMGGSTSGGHWVQTGGYVDLQAGLSRFSMSEAAGQVTSFTISGGTFESRNVSTNSTIGNLGTATVTIIGDNSTIFWRFFDLRANATTEFVIKGDNGETPGNSVSPITSSGASSRIDLDGTLKVTLAGGVALSNTRIYSLFEGTNFTDTTFDNTTFVGADGPGGNLFEILGTSGGSYRVQMESPNRRTTTTMTSTLAMMDVRAFVDDGTSIASRSTGWVDITTNPLNDLYVFLKRAGGSSLASYLAFLDANGYTVNTDSPTLLGVNNGSGVDFDLAILFNPDSVTEYFAFDTRDFGISFSHVGVWDQLAPVQEPQPQPQPQPQPSPQPGGAVPEPATLALLSLAGAAMLRRRRA